MVRAGCFQRKNKTRFSRGAVCFALQNGHPKLSDCIGFFDARYELLFPSTPTLEQICAKVGVFLLRWEGAVSPSPAADSQLALRLGALTSDVSRMLGRLGAANSQEARAPLSRRK